MCEIFAIELTSVPSPMFKINAAAIQNRYAQCRQENGIVLRDLSRPINPLHVLNSLACLTRRV